MAVTVSRLALAPVKGLRLMPAEELELSPTGPVGDRAFVVVDDERKLRMTTRTPKLLQVQPAFDPSSGELRLRFPGGGEAAAVPEPAERAEVRMYNGRPVTGDLVEGPLAEALTEHLGRPTALVALDPAQTGADDAPVTLMS